MALVSLGGFMAKTMGVREAALEFGLPESLIYNAVSRGQLPGVSRLGKRIILNRERFEEFFEGIAPEEGDDRHHVVETVVEPKPNPRTGKVSPIIRPMPDFIIEIIQSFASEGLSAKDVWRRLGGKETGAEVLHDGRTFRMPSQWAINKYVRFYNEGLSDGSINNLKTKRAKESTATVQQETNKVNEHRVHIGNTFDCVNCGEQFKKDHRLILTAMQGHWHRSEWDKDEYYPPSSFRKPPSHVRPGDPRLTSYAVCGASCLIEFTTKKEREQWILTPLRSKVDLEQPSTEELWAVPAFTTEDSRKPKSLWRKLRVLAAGKD